MLTIGYLYRTEGRYGQAREQYQRALTYFSKGDLSSEEANTRNNLAFVLAMLGRLPAARKHIEQALQIRQQEGKPYPVALSRNTLGHIYILEDHPERAERECKEALKFFESFKAPRGIGMACNSLGFALRQLGNHWKLGEAIYAVNESERFFRESVEYLSRARQIFTEVKEPLRLWDANNELGSLYCDWGWFAQQKKEVTAALEHYATSIQYQKEALAIAEEHHFLFQKADSLDDLAQAFGDQSFLLLNTGQPEAARESRSQAVSYLDMVEKLIPEAFKLVPDIGFGDAPEPGEAYWLSLGKVHFWQGVWSFRDLAADRVTSAERELKAAMATTELIEAVAYFQRYDDSRSYLLQRTIRYITDFVQQERIPAQQLHKQIDAYAQTYLLNLRVLHEAIDDMLGV
jgi:tetratricopeptide (TPR) repeat protein